MAERYSPTLPIRMMCVAAVMIATIAVLAAWSDHRARTDLFEKKSKLYEQCLAIARDAVKERVNLALPCQAPF